MINLCSLAVGGLANLVYSKYFQPHSLYHNPSAQQTVQLVVLSTAQQETMLTQQDNPRGSSMPRYNKASHPWAPRQRPHLKEGSYANVIKSACREHYAAASSGAIFLVELRAICLLHHQSQNTWAKIETVQPMKYCLGQQSNGDSQENQRRPWPDIILNPSRRQEVARVSKEGAAHWMRLGSLDATVPAPAVATRRHYHPTYFERTKAQIC